MSTSSLISIASFDTLPKAEMARIALEQEGIRAVLADANMVATDWLLSNAIGGIKLQVSLEDVQRARNALEVQSNHCPPGAQPKGSIRCKCVDCGAALEFPASRRGGVETCSACQAYVDVPGASDPSLD